MVNNSSKSGPSPAGPLGRAVFAPGDILFMEGDPADAMYLIHSGEVGMIVRGADGFFDTLEMRGAGQVLGELALTSDRPHTMGARASSDCRVIVIKRAMLQQKLAAAEPFVQALFRILVRNLLSVMDLKAEISAQENEQDAESALAELNDHISHS